MTNHTRTGSGVVVAACLALVPSTLAQSGSPIDNTPLASADTREAELGPNVGSQPKSPKTPAVASGLAPGEPAVPAAPEASPFHLTLAVDWTNAYFFRGFRQEASGLIIQPYADGVLDLGTFDDATLSLALGTWHSFHSEATGAAGEDGFGKYWYEADYYAGADLSVGPWACGARYYFYTSPSNVFGTIEELVFTVAFDDSEFLGEWSLQPSAVLGIETGSNATDGGRNGVYLQLGVAPGFSFDAGAAKGIEASFPVSVGLSLSNYYEGANGENDAFGFASVGAQASLPLNPDTTGGVWTLRAGVQCLFLGDATRSFNNDDRFEVIGTVGVSLAF
ncbi:MAG: hypothetical protein ACKVS8_05890 [Phycisphaerales bacterium]